MKNTILYFLLFLSISNLKSQSFNLTVETGYGSGSYNYGDSIHVWADAPSQEYYFDHWGGNGTKYLTLNEWHTTMSIPSGTNDVEVRLTAIYKKVNDDILVGVDSVWLWGEYQEDASTRFRMNKELYYWVPDNPKAAVFFLHGTGGQAKSMAEKYEIVQMRKLLNANGYAVFSFSSNESNVGDQDGNEKIRWIGRSRFSTIDNNIDLLNTKGMEVYIREHFNLENAPFFSMGVSNGAVFSDLVAATFDYKAVGHIVGVGGSRIFNTFDNPRPTIWIMVENDHNESADNDKAYQNYITQLNRGIESEWFMLKKSPMYPYRFTRNMSNISKTKSANIVRQMRSQGIIDNDGYITIDDLEKDFPFQAFYAAVNLKPRYQRDAKSQLKIVNADHSAPSDFMNQIIRFFDQQLIKTNITIPMDIIGIDIYPNPCSDFIKLSKGSGIKTHYIIYSLDGNVVATGINTGDYIDVSHLHLGIYYMVVNTSEHRYVSSFVKN